MVIPLFVFVLVIPIHNAVIPKKRYDGRRETGELASVIVTMTLANISREPLPIVEICGGRFGCLCLQFQILGGI